MGRVLTRNNFSFWLYDDDHNPPHVHVRFGGCEVIIGLKDLEVMEVTGKVHGKVLKRIMAVVVDYQQDWLEQWEEIHG